jgi:hypothetical protein
MGIGLQWAGANDAMAQSVRQRIMDQIAAEQRQKADTQQQFENQMREKQFQSGEELKRAQLDAMIQARQQGEADRQQKSAGDVAERMPAGTDLPINSPIVGQLRAAGYGGLLTDKPLDAPPPPDALAADPNAGPSPLTGTIANAPSPIAGRLVVKGATQKQAEAKVADQRKADEITSKSADLDAKMAHLSEQTQIAWERLRQEGDNATNRASLAKAAADLAQAKLDASIQHNQDQASRTPQPQYFNDASGVTHAAIFDKGEFKEIPLPKGFTPTKAVAPGMWDRLKGLFSSSAPAAGPVVTGNPTDPNWGK